MYGILFQIIRWGMLPNKAVTCHTEIRSIHARDHYMSITMQIFWPWWVLGPSVLIFLRGTSSIFSHPSGCRHLDPDRSLKTFARAADRYEYFKRAKDYRNASIVTACGLYIRSLGSWISASIYLDFFVGYMNDRQEDQTCPRQRGVSGHTFTRAWVQG